MGFLVLLAFFRKLLYEGGFLKAVGLASVPQSEKSLVRDIQPLRKTYLYLRPAKKEAVAVG